MRILHLAPRLSDRGGADVHLLSLLDGLHQAGIEQHLAAGRIECRVPAPVSPACLPALQERTGLPASLDELVVERRPSVIHLHNVVNPDVLDWAVGRNAVLSVQDHRVFCPGRGKWTAADRVCEKPLDIDRCRSCFTDDAYFRRIWTLTLRRLAAVKRMRKVLVLSEYMRRQLAMAGVPGECIQVIPPFPYALPTTPPVQDSPCVLFVGRLVLAKGVLDAVAAWKHSGVDLPLIMAGTGSARNDLLRRGVDVRGWIDRAALARLYRCARLVVMPSRWQEPFGIVGLESLSFGIPVVAYRSGGIPEWHPGSGLVEWGDVRGLAGAIAGLIDQQANLPEGFAAQASMRRLRSLYEQIH